MVTTEVVGLSLYLLIWWFLVGELWTRRSQPAARWCLLILSVCFIHSQTNVISIGEEMIFWTILGLTAGEPHLPVVTGHPLLRKERINRN